MSDTRNDRGHGASPATDAASDAARSQEVNRAATPAATGTDLRPATSGATERFENPGLPPHRNRMADTDAVAARRAERQVAACFVLSMVGTVLTIVGYFLVPLAEDTSAGAVLTSNILLGSGLFLALMGIGVGAVHWAKTLMPDHEAIEERHVIAGSPEDKAAAAGILSTGAAESGIGRRPLIRNTLVGALVLAPLPAVVLLKDTGPNPEGILGETLWEPGTHLVSDPGGERIRAEEIPIGGVVHVQPEGIEESSHFLDEKAKAAVLLMRLQPEELAEGSRPGSFAGIVAYSKICTHMGCPVALYEQTTNHLLCPCHQSTFDVAQDCKVIFGPADRALPQLPIAVDDDGYLVATDGFDEPVGPSYWEREFDARRMTDD